MAARRFRARTADRPCTRGPPAAGEAAGRQPDGKAFWTMSSGGAVRGGTPRRRCITTLAHASPRNDNKLMTKRKEEQEEEKDQEGELEEQ